MPPTKQHQTRICGTCEIAESSAMHHRYVTKHTKRPQYRHHYHHSASARGPDTQAARNQQISAIPKIACRKSHVSEKTAFELVVSNTFHNKSDGINTHNGLEHHSRAIVNISTWTKLAFEQLISQHSGKPLAFQRTKRDSWRARKAAVGSNRRKTLAPQEFPNVGGPGFVPIGR